MHFRLRFAVSLCLGLTACTQTDSPAASSAASTAQPLALPPEQVREPTFETFPTTTELLTLMRNRLKDAIDTTDEQQALAELQAELDAFQYTASDTIALEAQPEEPLGTSFMADMQAMEARLEALYGGTVEVSCGVRPCVQYGDFDGDDLKDLAVQVVENGNDRAGIAILLSNGTHALVGAGQGSALGDDLLWVEAWRLAPRQAGNQRGVSFRLYEEGREATIEVGTTTPGQPAPVSAYWLGDRPAE